MAQVIKFGEDVALQGSHLNDVRFHSDCHTAFITIPRAVRLPRGRPGQRKARSALDGHPSTQPDKAVEVTIDGQQLQRVDGRGFLVSADGLALSRDGKTLYWQPLTGRTLYSIDTAAVMSDDPEEAGKKVNKVGTSNLADGLLMSRDDRLFLTSPEDNSVKVWDGSRSRTLVEDPRLRWPDSLAEGPDRSIYVTASHIQDMPWFKADAPRVLPTQLFRMVPTSAG